MIIRENLVSSIKRLMIIVILFCCNYDFIISQDHFQYSIIQNYGDIFSTITEDFNYIMEFMERGEYEKGIDELIKVTQPIKDNRNRERRNIAERKRRANMTDEERDEHHRKERERYAKRKDEEE